MDVQYLAMRATVQLLRLAGRRLPAASEPVAGLLETECHVVNGQRSSRLVLRHVQSAPGAGTIYALHLPTVTGVDHDAIRLRGIEQAEGGAAVVQEWRVVPLR